MMQPMRAKIFIFFLTSLFLFTPSAFGQSPKAKEIDTYVKAFADADQFWGVVLAAEDGKIIYEKAFGMANADFKIPNQTNTRFGIASITKPMTSIILTRLIEEKKIALEDKLAKFIPDFPSGDKITIEMLRTHRSGIQHRVMKPEEESLAYTSAEFIEKVKQSQLAFEPGAQRLYSSGGYAVLARTLEIASGKPYTQLLQEYVFAPAGMRDSLDFNSETIMERRSQDYLLEAQGVINAPLKDYSFLVGAGSVYGTAGDLYKFGEAIFDGKYGETVRNSQTRDNQLAFSGSTNGHRAHLSVNRNKKWSYAIVSNLGSGAFDLVQQSVEAILDGRQVSAPRIPNPKIDLKANKNLEEFAGRYVRQGGGEFTIVAKNNILDAGGIKIYPTGKDRFFEYKFFGEVIFVRDTADKIKEIRWISPGVESVWVRQ